MVLQKQEKNVQKSVRAASNFVALIPSRLIRQMLAIFLQLNSKELYQCSGEEKDSCCLMFLPAIKRQIGYFPVVVVRRRLRNVQKSVIHVQSCCLANLDLLHFCRRFSLLSPSLLLKFPIDQFSPLSLVTVPQVFAKVFSSQFPTRF